MMLTLPEELRAAVKESGNRPLRLINPDTNAEFILMPAEMANLMDGERLSHEEQLYLLRQAGRRAGWDDPEMDVYNDL